MIAFAIFWTPINQGASWFWSQVYPTPTPTTPTPTKGQNIYARSLLVTCSATDKFAGTAITSATVKIIDPSTTLTRETITIASAAGTDSVYTYKTGDPWVVDISKGSTTSKAWWQFAWTVPYAETLDASEKYKLSMALVSIGTYTSFSISCPNGTAITNGQVYNSTDYNQGVFTWTQKNTADNTGFMGTFTDKQTGRKLEQVGWLKITASSGAVQSFVADWTAGYEGYQLKNFYKALPDRGLDRIKNPAGEYSAWGTYPLTFTLDTSGMGSTDTETLTFYLYTFCDITYVNAHGGTFNTEAVQGMGTMAIQIWNKS